MPFKLVGYQLYFFFLLCKVRQATSRLGSIEKQLTDRTSESGLHEAKLKELQEELESRTRRNGELEGTLEAKEIELKESASLVDRVKALHGEQCNELQRQIQEVRKTRYMYTGTPFYEEKVKNKKSKKLWGVPKYLC